MSVELVLIAGTDLDIVNCARVSLNRQSQELSDADRGLIARLMRDGHSSPFTGGWAKFRISCSIGCSRQIARNGHYVELNEYSTRYSEVTDEFVYPEMKRQIGKAMDYQFQPLDTPERHIAEPIIEASYRASYAAYQQLRNQGIAREDARSVLPLGTMTHLIVSSHLKGWLRFLSQRTDPHAQDEVRDIALEIEGYLRTKFPVSLDAWDSYGRKAL